MAQRGTLEVVGQALGELFAPLEDSLGTPAAAKELFTELGLVLPDSFLTQPAFATRLQAGATAAGRLPGRVTALVDAAAAEDLAQILSASTGLFADVDAVVGAVKAIATQLRASAGAVGTVGVGPVETFADELPERLLEFLAVRYLDRQQRAALAVAYFLGLAQDVVERADIDDPNPPSTVRRSLRLDRLPDLLQDPFASLVELYQWDETGVDAAGMLEAARRLLTMLGRLVYIEPNGPGGLPELRARDAVVRPRPDLSPPGLEITIAIDIPAGVDVDLPLMPGVSLRITAEAAMAEETKITVQPPLTLRVEPPAGQVSGSIKLEVVMSSSTAGRQMVLLGKAGGSRLEATTIRAGGGVELAWQAPGGPATGGITLSAALKGGKLVIDLSDGDGFIQSTLGAQAIEADFEIGVSWRPNSGLTFDGGAGLELMFATRLELGPVTVTALFLRLGTSTDAPIELGVGVAFTTTLGPLTVTVERLGFKTLLTFPSEGANLQFANLDVKFQAPTGLGLSIDGRGFKGGGFLTFDQANERYAGVLELEFQDFISIKAIALLTTRLPGGEEGFSLLIIITAEFNPIQLGFGFTLNGVGGLLGLNRTMRVERLRTGIRDNTLESILFPTDVVANANRIISDLREVFPPRDDRFVFGPMAELGWGTPTLITGSLGLIIEVPDPVRIVILGVIKALLPDEDVPLLRLQVNFLGGVDTEKKLLFFDATIYDSKLLSISLSGDMALRISWGNNPNFLLTVGGFHPAYDPPPLALPDIRRLTMQLLSGTNPRLTLETYFAVTSNTVQFGARLEFYAGAGPFNVYGYLSFDVLFQFDPFYFNAAIGAMLALRAGSGSIASIKLSLNLEGPTPWKAAGTAKLTLFWFLTIKVRFSKTFGEERDTRLDAIDILPLVTAALKKDGNWRADIPTRSHLLVSIKKIEPPADVIVAHPFGVLTVSQKVVPLNLTIDKFGNQLPQDDSRFEITNVRAGADELPLAVTSVKEFFAPAQFFEKTDSEKLSSRAFEQYDAGIQIAESGKLKSDHYVKREVEYELTYIDSQRNLILWGVLILPYLAAFDTWSTTGAIARSALSHARKRKSALAPDEVLVAQEGYAVVTMSDLTLVNADVVADSEAEALAMMNQLIGRSAALRGQIQVVPAFEVSR